MVRYINEVVYVSVMPPISPLTRIDASVEDKTTMVLEQVKRCLEEAGSSLERVLACSVHCTSAGVFPAVSALCKQYFPAEVPELFVVPGAAGSFDIEVECVALAGP
ncbi:RidA family protein [Ramlibacter sp. AN1133]|uniref:RidA family protein n=1 Tax=Ramlibacter sp. AN1133 TaxID=3133429 RepID=UPI0030C1979D